MECRISRHELDEHIFGGQWGDVVHVKEAERLSGRNVTGIRAVKMGKIIFLGGNELCDEVGHVVFIPEAGRTLNAKTVIRTCFVHSPRVFHGSEDEAIRALPRKRPAFLVFVLLKPCPS